jgi:protein translocase SecG subunit
MTPVLFFAATAGKLAPSPAVSAVLPKGALPRGAVPPNVPGVPPVPAGPAPTTWIASHLPWLTHGIAGLFLICAILLIALLAAQTTKQEGLTGSIGGRVESAYRGRLGAEEQLKRWTGFVAVCFVVTGFVLSLTGI